MAGSMTMGVRLAGEIDFLRAATRWLVAVLVVCGLVLSSAMVNPVLHQLIDGDRLDAAVSASISAPETSTLAAHNVDGKIVDPSKALAGVICSSHCAAHFAGTLPVGVEAVAVTPAEVAWPRAETRQPIAWRPFSLDRPPRA